MFADRNRAGTYGIMSLPHLRDVVIVGVGGLLFGGLSLINQVLRSDKVAHGGEAMVQKAQRGIHMDLSAQGQEDLSKRTIATRG